MWRREIEENLKRQRPALYADLIRSGKLEAELDRRAEVASDIFDDAMVKLMRHAPEGFVGRSQWALASQIQAREIVRDAVLERSEEPGSD